MGSHALSYSCAGPKALNLKTGTIRANRNKLDDIAAEAIELLKDKPMADMGLRLLKRVKSYRRVEMAELMNLSSTYTAAYANSVTGRAVRPASIEVPLRGMGYETV